METGVGDMDKGMDAEAKVAEGLRLIDESSLEKSTKKTYSGSWRRWVNWCADVGVDPLGACWEDVLRALPSLGSTISSAKRVLVVVAFVYRSMGVASPSHDRRLVPALGKKRWHASFESFSEASRRRLSLYRSDYLAWCGVLGKKPAPASGEQMVEFLSSVSDHLSYQEVTRVSTAVSLYQTEQGHPPTESHPLVVAALKELLRKRAARGVDGAAGDGKPLGVERARWYRQWETWRECQGIERGRATVDDVLEYLREHEHERTAGRKAIVLRNVCKGEEEAFWSEEVQSWLEEFKARLGREEVPGNSAVHMGRSQVVLAEWSAARAARAVAERQVPVGLTREEVERRRVGEGLQLEESTIKKFTYVWATFSEWRNFRGIPLESVEPVHVRVYLEDAADWLTVASLWKILEGLTFGFEEHGFTINPAEADEVVDYLRDLQVERKEAPTQMDPIREAEFKAILDSAFEPRSWERKSRSDLRGALTVSLVRVMFDGLLRGSEASRARWGDLSRSGDGTGSLLLPRSKTDKFGRGECTYVSAVALQHLDLMRDLRRFYGKGEQEDDRIFGIEVARMGTLIEEACSYAGLVGRFGTHSLRIGGAQELALAGFSLPMIMLAGRWDMPNMAQLYIRNIKVQESAMAELQRMLATGKHRLGPDARGIDIMSNYALVRLAR